ncbi:hypothetical protein BGX27_006290, partial [Mortierella sp. AM989]
MELISTFRNVRNVVHCIASAHSDARACKDPPTLLQCFAQGKDTLESSGRILHRWPMDNHQNYYLKWASPHVQAEIVKQLEDKSWKELLKDLVTGGKDIARGPLFELYVPYSVSHRIFESVRGQCKMSRNTLCTPYLPKRRLRFEIKSLTPNSKTGVFNILLGPPVTPIRTVDEFSSLPEGQK